MYAPPPVLRLVFAVAAASLAVLSPATTDAAARSGSNACVKALDALTVVAACNGSLGGTFRLTSGRGRMFQAGPAPNVARLRGVVLSPGDRIAIAGTAGAGATVVALDVDAAGVARLVRFEDLGLEHGGHDTLTVSGAAGTKRFRLVRADGTTVSPTTITRFTGRRYIASVVVRRSGGTADIAFTPVSATTEVALLTNVATQDMLETGELENPFLVGKTVKTRPGTPTHVTLPLRARASWVYVKPLGPSLVLPGLARLR